jgi:hypothetical protein
MRNFLFFMEPECSLSNLHDSAKSEALRNVGLVWFGLFLLLPLGAQGISESLRFTSVS